MGRDGHGIRNGGHVRTAELARSRIWSTALDVPLTAAIAALVMIATGVASRFPGSASHADRSGRRDQVGVGSERRPRASFM